VSAYQLADWANFAVASAGAAAALTGLLFVAVSINLKRILEFPQLPDRAAGTLGLLLTILLVAVVLLAPGQPRQATGVEIAALSALLACGAVMIALRTYAHVHDPLSWVIRSTLLLLGPALAFMIGGISTAIEAGGGLYWVLGGVLAGFAGACANAWVLLVEIQR
jgi:modulator of FtsH protease